MAVKKAFEPLMAFLALEENQNKKVKAVMAEIQELVSAKGAGGVATTVRKDEAGNVTHILDYYFKTWMPLSHVEFGKKEGSASGYNTMSKEGVSHWSKQQRDFKSAKESLLDDVAAGKVQPAEIAEKLTALETERTKIVPQSANIGFATLEEALAADPASLDALVAERDAREAQELADAQAAAEAAKTTTAA